MVNIHSEKINHLYLQLLHSLNQELKENASVVELVTYIKNKEVQFKTIQSKHTVLDLKEFIRGANRFADEFEISETHRYNIKKTINELYEALMLAENMS